MTDWSDNLFTKMKIEAEVRAEKNRLIAKPVCSPNRLLPHPISHGPSTPPIPAKVKRTPKSVFMFSDLESETAAVMVGKMIDKKKPVRGREKVAVEGISRPSKIQTNAPRDAKKMERR